MGCPSLVSLGLLAQLVDLLDLGGVFGQELAENVHVALQLLQRALALSALVEVLVDAVLAQLLAFLLHAIGAKGGAASFELVKHRAHGVVVRFPILRLLDLLLREELAQLSGCNVSATANFAIRDWLIANYEKLWKLYGGDL